jgi:hypothetical protein
VTDRVKHAAEVKGISAPDDEFVGLMLAGGSPFVVLAEAKDIKVPLE